MRYFTARAIKPSGWIKKQLTIQANGLSGNLYKVWPDVKDSAWIGGDKEGWERVPYWLDGFIPLAYLLEDDELIKVAKKYVYAIIKSQKEDGWICPCKDEERSEYDTWAVLLIAKVLTVYANCSGEEELIIKVLTDLLKNLSEHINYSLLKDWGRARWYEGLIAIEWLYERIKEDWLVTLAHKLNIQGTDWRKVIDNDILDEYSNKWNLFSHVVNIAMMFKSEALMTKFSGGNADEFAEKAYAYIIKKYGNAYGHFNGDECLAPKSPIRGSELCSIVEAMYSYEKLFEITKEPKWLERVEKLAYNALPATMSPDMWTHQYDQQANQVQCAPLGNSLFATNTNDAHIFGLEPNFGCCTSNFSQGWPKFVLSAYAYDESRIISCLQIPSKLKTKVKGADVEISTITEFPFKNTVSYQINTEKPVEFEFLFYVPSYVKSAECNGKTLIVGQFEKIKKVWYKDTLNITYTIEPKLKNSPNNMKCLWHGPLLFSLPIKSKWEMQEYEMDGVERKYPYCDYHIYPQNKWNYGYCRGEFEVNYKKYKTPFDEDMPPIEIWADLKEIQWNFNKNGYCEEKPTSTDGDRIQKMKIIPYGCTTLRMTEMPLIEDE